ncbi:MAG: two-component regulator propeller domain-containing protein [Saprospiraceae bacterium]|nr:two-component regulator propeller domain-containing protein [Saprospiraceae bacterium]
MAGAICLDAQRFQALNEQLPLSRADGIYQDRYGFLWICTIDGLLKYDGYAFQAYRPDPRDSTSLPYREVNVVCEDSAGLLWVGMEAAGLATFDRDTETFSRVCLRSLREDCGQDLTIYSLCADHEGWMWAGTDRGLFGVKGDSVRHCRFQRDDPTTLSGNHIFELFADHHGQLWVGTNNGPNLLDRSTWGFSNHRNKAGFPDLPVLDFGADQQQTLWMSLRFHSHRMHRWNETTRAFIPDPRFEMSGEFRFTIADDNQLWISSRGMGCFHYDPAGDSLTFFNPLQPEHHGYRGLYSFDNLQDRYGNVWTIAEHVFKWPATGKKVLTIRGDGQITSAVYADDRYIWYCGGKPRRWNRQTREVEDYWPEGTIRNRREDARVPNFAQITEYADYDADHFIFSTTRNLFIWNRHDDTYLQRATRYGGPFRDFTMISPDSIWVMANQDPPILFDLDAATWRIQRQAQRIAAPTSVDHDGSGDLWIGTADDGVYRYRSRDTSFVHFNEENSGLPSDYVTSVLCDDDGVIWIGTNLGLARLDPRTASMDVYRQHDGLLSEHIASIEVDQDGNIWIGTQQGLSNLEVTTGMIRNFSEADGFINTVYSYRASFADKHGYLYFGGDRGVDAFHPDEIGHNPVPPDLYLRRITINNALHKMSVAPERLSALRLPPGANVVELELAALHFTAPGQNRYAYRFADGEWIDLGTNRTITLANSAPGTYRIEARAANSDGIWSEPKQILALTLLPPWWKTTWFYVICALLVSGLVYAAYRYRLTQVRRDARRTTEFNKRIAEIEMKALRAQMNPHFLFNSLNSVKSLIAQGANDKATDYLTRFSQLIRQVLNNSRRKFIRLQEEIEALRLYLDLEKMRFQNFDYTIDIGEDVNADFIEVPPLLLQPYVENAIWHGLMHKANGTRKLDIRVHRDGSHIRMVVEDNGIGRRQSESLKTRSSSKKESLGMKISGDRLRFLQEVYGHEAFVQIEDLEQPTGTRVTISLPVAD